MLHALAIAIPAGSIPGTNAPLALEAQPGADWETVMGRFQLP
jgi:hypothetical protein